MKRFNVGLLIASITFLAIVAIAGAALPANAADPSAVQCNQTPTMNGCACGSDLLAY